MYNQLFAQLLADRSQRFAVLNLDNSVRAIIITEILEDTISQSKTLNIRCLYSFKPASNEEWSKVFDCIIDAAKAEKCTTITFQTSNQKIRSIARFIGAEELTTTYRVKV